MSPSAFEIEVEFKIDGKGVNLYGDGFALWLTRSRAQMGPVFGSSGPARLLWSPLTKTDHWDGLGIMLDTYPNSRHSVREHRLRCV